MARSDFNISITKDAVDVKFTPSGGDPRSKRFGLIFVLSTLVVLTCALLFLPGKDNHPSMWHDLTDAPLHSMGYFAPIIGLIIFVTLFGWWSFHYARAAWPSDETFHCDRQAITISRVPWLDFHDRTWTTRTYPLTQVTAIRYAVIASARGAQYWGLRFSAHGRKWALPDLEAPDAKAILIGLKALGADVPDDPKLEKRLKEWKEMQFGNTDWMDRSWMEPDKNPDNQ